MASIVFFRAINVGGHQRCQPSNLARELAAFDVVNVGAAGTLVVRKAVSQASLRKEILRRLHFEPELMICPGQEVMALAANDPFGQAPSEKVARRFVTILEKRPLNAPSLPFQQPAGKIWQVQVLSVRGRFVVSLWRPKKPMLYPNAVIEKQFGLAATTRSWNTIARVCEILEE